MLILKITSRIVWPKAEVHCVNHESIGENFFYGISIRVYVILGPWLETEPLLSYFFFK